jgi:hypothetical protein
MRRTLLGACGLMMVWAAISVSGQASDPWVGTWKHNLEKPFPLRGILEEALPPMIFARALPALRDARRSRTPRANAESAILGRG